MQKHRKCVITRWWWLGAAFWAVLLSLAGARGQDARSDPASEDAPQASRTVDLRLRFEWAGQTPQRWNGLVRLGEGVFRDVQSVGMRADEPSSIVLSRNQVHVFPRSPGTYDGFDVSVRAPIDARLFINLDPIDQSMPSPNLELPISKLIDGYDESKLERTDHRLFVRRAPGDKLRVRLRRPSLVFSPGEKLVMGIRPHELKLSAGEAVKLSVQLSHGRGGEVLSRHDQDIHVTDDGNAVGETVVTLDTPLAEGVYEARLSISKKRLGAWVVPRQLVPEKQLASRSVEFVVIQDAAIERASEAWTQVSEIDPVNPANRWQQWMSRIPGFGNGPLQFGAHQQETILGTPMIRLPSQAWVAYPLEVRRVDQPHILEIEYPETEPQTLALTIVETDEAGVARSTGTDVGIHVPQLPPGHAGAVKRFRFVFWPSTPAPLILIANMQKNATAAFGKMRVLAGGVHLPKEPSAVTSRDQRLVIAHLDQPSFPDAFAAGRQFEPTRNAGLDDWTRFYRGGSRLADHLVHSGYNAAAIPVVSDGSALYPSRLIDPNPRHDTGTFFKDGRDPVKKDVLEMLLRLFDREGLKLIATIEFSAPLPELEMRKRSDPKAAAGIDLVNSRGRTWGEASGSSSGLAPRYNPLDHRVQAAMHRVIAELIDRYSHHKSFAGVGIQLGPHCFSLFPGDDWGYDPHSVQQFYTDMEEPGGEGMALAAKVRRLKGEAKVRWLNWRAHKLAELYQALQKEVGRGDSDRRLYLMPRDLLDAPRFWDDVRPTLPSQTDIAGLMLQMGIDSRLFARNPRVVLMQPRTAGPITSAVHKHALPLTLNDSPEMSEYFDQGDVTAVAISHGRIQRRLESFEQVSPWGPEKTFAKMDVFNVPSGHYNRQRFIRSLARHDKQVLMDGGWTLPRGGESELRGLFETFRKLPGGRFETLKPRTAKSGDQPIVVRELVAGTKRHFYVVNDSPWPVSLRMSLTFPGNSTLVTLGDHPSAKLSPRQGKAEWRVDLDPYDLVGAVLTSTRATIDDWDVQFAPPLLRTIESELAVRVASVRNRANKLHEQPPMNVLASPGFDAPGGLSEGWVHANGRGVSVRAETKIGRNGSSALRLRHDGPVGRSGPFAWIRSDSFSPPSTGRIAVVAWLRVADKAKQPPLRVAIEGKWNGQDFYRYYEVGVGQDVDRVRETWTQFLFAFNNLPPDGLTELRVGFDMMGTGEVLIDDVELLDLWFEDNERQQIVLDVGEASLNLRHGKIDACHRFLGSYWARLLMEHAPGKSVRVAQVPAATRRLQPSSSAGDRATPLSTDAKDPEEPTSWGKIKDKATRWVPKFW